MTLIKLLATTTAVLLISCGGSSSSSDPVTSKKESASAPKVTKSCLEKYAMEPCNLLTMQEVAAIVDVNPELVETKPPLEMFKDSKMRACSFEWESDRKMSVKTAAGVYEIDVDNSVIIGLFRLLEDERRKIEIPYTEWFDNAHREITEEEKAAFTKSMTDKLTEELETEAEVETGKKLGGGLMDMAMSIEYENIDGIGDRASAETNASSPDVSLNILHGSLTFVVKVNVSDDRSVNKAKAISIAKAIMALCD